MFYPPPIWVFFATTHSGVPLTGSRIEFRGATRSLCHDITLQVSPSESCPGMKQQAMNYDDDSSTITLITEHKTSQRLCEVIRGPTLGKDHHSSTKVIDNTP